MRKYGLIIALLIGAGCKSTEGPDPIVTTTVQVSSTPTQIAVGETAQASAIVKDQNGAPLTGKTITWTSLNQSIATVTAAGLIRGVAPGNATIQGSVDGITGTATITVIQISAVCVSGPTVVDPAVGNAVIISSNDAKGCIKIPSSATAGSYLLIASNNNALPDQTATYSLKSDEGENVPGSTLLVSPLKIAASLSLPVVEFPGAMQASFESKLRKMERRELNFAEGARAYAARYSASSGVRQSVSLAVPAVGDKTTFKVPAKFDASGNSLGGGCANFTQATATVKYVSNRAIIYLDDAAPSGGFTDTDFQEIATEFDNLIYQTDVDYFGTPDDLDSNSRIIMLYTPLVNKLTPVGSSGFVGGFFFVGDLFPVAQCGQSNVAEIFYALAPDPNGTINNNVRTTATVRQGTRGTVAHEFQHMINGSERLRKFPVTQDFESTWLDEALAHYAEDLNGRAIRGYSETGNYNDGQLRVNINDYAAFFFQNFARFRLYLANPGPNSPTSAMADTSLAVRGAAWALVRYSADHYAPGGDIKAFIRSLVPGPDTGVVNLTNHASNVTFNELISGWMIANYADDTGISNLQTKYTYKTYDMRDAVRHVVSNQPALQIYPLNPVTISGTGFGLGSLTARSGSGNYFTFSRAAGGPARTFRLLNSDLTTAASFPGASFIVLRTQ